MGDEEAAAKSHRKLLQVATDDASVQGRAAAFFADRDPALAETVSIVMDGTESTSPGAAVSIGVLPNSRRGYSAC